MYENKQAIDYNGKKDIWVFIADETTRKYLGWIMKSALINATNFEVFEPDLLLDVTYEKGDLIAQIIIQKNGIFSINWKAKGQGLYLKGNDQGQLYIYEDIVWAKKNNQDYLYNFFILDDTNHLNHEYRFRLDTMKMTMYTLPEK